MKLRHISLLLVMSIVLLGIGSFGGGSRRAGGGGGSGTVTSIACGFGLTCTPSPITTSGTVAHNVPSASDQVFVSDSTSAATWRTLPDCVDTGGNHLNYTASTNLFSCGTSGGGGGTPASPSTSIQFNNAGSFGGSSDYTIALTNHAVTHTVAIGDEFAHVLTANKTSYADVVAEAGAFDVVLNLSASTGVSNSAKASVRLFLNKTGDGALATAYPVIGDYNASGAGGLTNGGYLFLRAPSGTETTNFRGIRLEDPGSAGSSVTTAITAEGNGLISAGRLATGTEAPSTKAALQSDSTTKGWLPPRMTTTQRDAITSPDEGLIVYNTTSHTINWRDNSAWQAPSSGGSGTVNSGTANNFAYYAATGTAVSETSKITYDGSILKLNNPSLSTGYLSTTKTAGTAGTTANLLAKLDSSGNAVTAAVSDVGILGIAVTTASSTNPVEIATRGIINCVADNSTTINNVLGVGTTTAGRCRDLGKTAAVDVCKRMQIIGRALTAVSAGSNVSVQLNGPAHYGTAACEATLTDAATVNTNLDITDLGILTTLSQASQFANPTGTLRNGQGLCYRVKSTTARALTWDTMFRAATGDTLPTTTTGSSKTDYFCFIGNSTDTKLDYTASKLSY